MREIYDKNNTRAQTNFALAAKLADKIGAQQAELMQLLQKGTTGSSSSSRPTTAAPTPSRSNSSYSYSQSSSSSSSTASNSNSDTASSSITGSSQPYQAPWERSLAEAKQRLKTLEQEAVASGSRAQRTAQESIEVGELFGIFVAVPAVWHVLCRGRVAQIYSLMCNSDLLTVYNAFPCMRIFFCECTLQTLVSQQQLDSVLQERQYTLYKCVTATIDCCQSAYPDVTLPQEARQRLRASAIESVSEARGRIRKSAVESISEARQRIAQQDAAMLARVHELVARYRRGEYVPESEIEWAFKQLETRVWRH